LYLNHGFAVALVEDGGAPDAAEQAAAVEQQKAHHDHFHLIRAVKGAQGRVKSAQVGV
jgi:hypothetical protein